MLPYSGVREQLSCNFFQRRRITRGEIRHLKAKSKGQATADGKTTKRMTSPLPRSWALSALVAILELATLIPPILQSPGATVLLYPSTYLPLRLCQRVGALYLGFVPTPKAVSTGGGRR